MKQETIYVIGHKNPDTDSIASALAYADIKNRTENTQEKIYIAARAGELNEETEFVLNYFKVKAPIYLSDVGTQVTDMEIRRTPGVRKNTSIRDAWRRMRKSEAVTLPVTTKEGTLEGIVTTGDIAKTYMDVEDSLLLARAKTSIKSIAETIDGKIIVGDQEEIITKGKTIIGAADPGTMGDYMDEGDLIILGNRYESHLKAIEQGAKCIVICVDSPVDLKIQEIAKKKNCVIISTPKDTFTVARLINLSIPLSFIMKKNNLITFGTDEYTDDIKEVMATTRHRAFPVINKNDKYVGTISRRNFLGMQKKQIILVDHNEKSQTVENIEDAEVLEIVDHHRLGTLETINPIYFRNQPVGCTATIIYEIYGEKNLEIPKGIAGLLFASIISDTLMFRSPTCTEKDRTAAEQLAEKINIDIGTFSKEMFRAGSNLRNHTIEEIFFQDFKKFQSKNTGFGVGQISSFDKDELGKLQKRLKPFMEKQCGQNGMSMVFYMLTSILDETSVLMCMGEGSEQLVKDAFCAGAETSGTDKTCYSLKGVVSRKKQLIPALIRTLQENE